MSHCCVTVSPGWSQLAGRSTAPATGAHWEVWSDISTHGSMPAPPPPSSPSTPSLHHPASHCSSPPRGSHTTARSTGQTARHCAPCLRSLRAARGAGGWAAAKQLDFLLTAAAAFSPALPLGGISEISLSLRMRGSAQRRGCRATNRGREGGARTTKNSYSLNLMKPVIMPHTRPNAGCILFCNYLQICIYRVRETLFLKEPINALYHLDSYFFWSPDIKKRLLFFYFIFFYVPPIKKLNCKIIE